MHTHTPFINQRAENNDAGVSFLLDEECIPFDLMHGFIQLIWVLLGVSDGTEGKYRRDSGSPSDTHTHRELSPQCA